MSKKYYDLNSFFRDMFGERVQKITVDAGFTCPNRDGKISYNGCIYCNEKGSGNGVFKKGISITEQIEYGKKKLSKRYKVKKYLAYFQAYTNTYAPVQKLKKIYDEALSIKDIVGLSIGTRPDCVDEKILNLLEYYAKKKLIWLEYGIQSVHNRTLALINRGHNFDSFKKAVDLTKKKNIKICAHVIIGLPGESSKDILETAKILADMEIDGIKLHLLYIIKGTPMENMYINKEYKCLEQIEYVHHICNFIEQLPSNIVIHRVTSDPHPEELVAPDWSVKKSETLLMIDKTFDLRNSYQGKFAQK